MENLKEKMLIYVKMYVKMLFTVPQQKNLDLEIGLRSVNCFVPKISRCYDTG